MRWADNNGVAARYEKAVMNDKRPSRCDSGGGGVGVGASFLAGWLSECVRYG